MTRRQWVLYLSEFQIIIPLIQSPHKIDQTKTACEQNGTHPNPVLYFHLRIMNISSSFPYYI